MVRRVAVETRGARLDGAIMNYAPSNKEKRIRIEFEYRSKSFKAHRHNSKRCDMIVCWEHYCPNVPDSIVQSTVTPRHRCRHGHRGCADCFVHVDRRS